MDIYGFRDAIKRKSREGMAVWGTCAGMIVIARKLLDRRPEPLGLMDIEVSRNAFGRQVDSFETDIQVSSMKGIRSTQSLSVPRSLLMLGLK